MMSASPADPPGRSCGSGPCVTVASTPLRASSSGIGRPTSVERPMTTARCPRSHAVALQQAHHPERGARHGPGEAAHQAARSTLGQPVDVLLRRDEVQHGLRVEAAGQRQLHEDAVHRGSATSRRQLLDLGLASVAGSSTGARRMPGLRPSCSCSGRTSGSAGRRRPARSPGTPAASPAASMRPAAATISSRSRLPSISTAPPGVRVKSVGVSLSVTRVPDVTATAASGLALRSQFAREPAT